jgi:cytochrome c oxidase assembly protein subunit 15
MVSAGLRRFQASLTVSLILVLLVIVAGATVRVTGSGMGCPDWPLCYDCWIPPVSVEQLPADYQTRFAVQGQLAHFDAVQTWIEYINRLLGALAGLAIVVSLALSVWVRQGLVFPVLSGLAVVFTALVAWLGARVVETYLAPSAVTAHLALALVILALLLYERELLLRRKGHERESVDAKFLAVLVFTSVAMPVQLYLGALVREANDLSWVHELPAPGIVPSPWHVDSLHRVSAGVLAAACGLQGYSAWKRRTHAPRLWFWSLLLGLCVATQAVLGLVMVFFPPADVVKPLHLLAATLAFCCWLKAWLVRASRRPGV